MQPAPQNLTQLIDLFIELIYMVIPVVLGIAVLVFFKGLIQFISQAGDEKSHADGKSLMVWGLIGLFVMVSIWGIVRFLFGEFGFTNFGMPLLPQ